MLRQVDMKTLEIRGTLETEYPDVYTPDVLRALEALSPLDEDRRALMAARIARRTARARNHERIRFLDPATVIPRAGLTVQAARDGNFVGSPIPVDLQRQWIQGTGPAARPEVPVETSIRNVAYALLSGADGWMFDAEDALGQLATMSLDNQRNLKLAISRAPGPGPSSAIRSSTTGRRSSASRRRFSARAGFTSTTATSGGAAPRVFPRRSST
jgi:malate synthase